MDRNYRKALQCLNMCSPVDQKNNCFDLDAKIPEKPRVPPMAKFREKDLCHEATEDLFVVPAILQGKGKGSFWYEPIFQVKTLEGEIIWRRCKYEVKKGKVLGAFYFNVLDNRVISNGFWTIMDVSDNFSCGLFHYDGATRVARQADNGAVLISPDGVYLKELESIRLFFALETCGIEWELFIVIVDNCPCHDPLLGIPEGSRLHSMINVKYQSWAS
ncbi:hypothetical protein SLEP1_g34683 [Rubroshorea leprosula]|uniref:Uncharacterized protein n=1 Tax=Rubroshorea leprosula TaxID=152421 RepID=A0AAV5KKS2_9ROSI|nr:hypothetical protein SLEP1_g34683 [Rubroshorea leprosula]